VASPATKTRSASALAERVHHVDRQLVVGVEIQRSLGGLLGAIAGGVVGNKTAACNSAYSNGYSSAPPPPPPPPRTSEYRDYGQQQPYAERGAYREYEDEGRWAYGHRGERYRLADRAPDTDGCALAESPIYMPDGRTQTRFVRVCRDSSGRYAVVD